MNNQEAFDTVAKHLFAQGEQAVDANGNCVYRLGKLKCAIGALIPDELYDPEWDYDQTAIENLILRSSNHPLRELFSDVAPYLLEGLQRIHDNAGNWKTTEALKTSLQNCAEHYGLSAKVLTGLSFPSTSPA